MDLPTYTNIWRIEKRLYKLYDVRLPMPLPISWIAVFAGITIPYVVLLVAIGLPFNHSLVALYILPPGLLTWLTTRPVIENKRLPELVESQVRYLTEPRTWVRLAPLSEKDQITVTAKVWRSRPARKPAPARAHKVRSATVSGGSVAVVTVAPGAAKPGTVTVPARSGQRGPVPGKPALPKPKLAALGPARPRSAPASPPPQPPRKPRRAAPGPSAGPAPAEPPATRGQSVVESAPARVRGGAPAATSLELSHDGPHRSGGAGPSVPPASGNSPSTWPAPASPLRPERRSRPAQNAPQPPQPPQPPPEPAKAGEPVPVPEPLVTETQNRPTLSVERALSGPARDRNLSWHGKVKIVTGAGATAGPGARDQEALDRNRARLPIAEPKRILVLGCTSGAGQTVTALMTASMLASLREQPVAAVDLHDGTLAAYREPAAALRELLAGQSPLPVTATRPDGLHPTPKPNPARLDVITSGGSLADGDEIKLAVQLNRHYPLSVLDPGAAGLTKLLKVTDQLVIVAPASADAAGALADTREWLDNNGHADLAMQSVTVINGASRRSLADVEQAESIARGRSRAIVRVPWDDMLPTAVASPSALRPQTRVAYTALAGVLVAGMAAAGTRARRQEKR